MISNCQKNIFLRVTNVELKILKSWQFLMTTIINLVTHPGEIGKNESMHIVSQPGVFVSHSTPESLPPFGNLFFSNFLPILPKAFSQIENNISILRTKNVTMIIWPRRVLLSVSLVRYQGLDELIYSELRWANLTVFLCSRKKKFHCMPIRHLSWYFLNYSGLLIFLIEFFDNVWTVQYSTVCNFDNEQTFPNWNPPDGRNYPQRSEAYCR